MTIAKSRGYKIPTDISFVGYTNGNVFKYVTPSITCINQHGFYMGKKAAEKVIERIEHKNNDNPMYETKIIKTNLVERESTYTLS